MKDYFNKKVDLEDGNSNLGKRLIIDNQNIKPMKGQPLIERIKELERFVETIYKKNHDLEIEILNLKSFTGIDLIND